MVGEKQKKREKVKRECGIGKDREERIWEKKKGGRRVNGSVGRERDEKRKKMNKRESESEKAREREREQEH